MTTLAPPSPHARRDIQSVTRKAPSRVARLVWGLSGLYLTAVVAVIGLVFVVSESWWVGTVLTYLPRAPWALPALVLGVLASRWHLPSLGINLLALLLVLGPLMEFRAPWLAEQRVVAAATEASRPLRFVSANVQHYRPDFAALLQEVHRHRPDVLVLQEAIGDHPLLIESFPDWHRLHYDYYWIGSRYPLRLLQECETAAFDRTAGLVVEIETPQGPIVVANIHQMTARRGLVDITASELASGVAQSSLEDFQTLRRAESEDLRGQIQAAAGTAPLIVAGDFNTPSSSSLFQATWGDLTSSFDVAGTGFGYTSPVKPHRFWFSYVPWARIDHILCSPDWQVRECRIGTGRGSDHHLIYAELSR